LPIRDVSHGERGITGIETAIVFVAFVVVATLFAFTALSTGLFTSDRGRETVSAGLAKSQGSLYVSGSVMVTTDLTQVTSVELTVALAAGSEPVDFDPASGTVFAAVTSATRISDLTYTTANVVGDGDPALEPGELLAVSLDIAAHPSLVLTANDTFAIEVNPPGGSLVVIQRTLPSSIARPVVDLN